MSNPRRRHRQDKRNMFRIQERRSIVQKLYSSGRTIQSISVELGTSVATIGRDVLAIKKMWREEIPKRLDEYVAEELQKLNAVERAAWEAWEAMAEAAFEAFIDGNGVKKYRLRTQILADGREVMVAPPPLAAYLEQIQKTITKRQELFGLGGREALEKLRELVAGREIAADNPIGLLLPELEPVEVLEVKDND